VSDEACTNSRGDRAVAMPGTGLLYHPPVSKCRSAALIERRQDFPNRWRAVKILRDWNNTEAMLDAS